MRICFFISNSLTTGGGAENWIIDSAKRLMHEGNKCHEIVIAALKYSEDRHIEYCDLRHLLSGIEYYEFPFIKLPRGVAIPHTHSISNLIDLFNTCDVNYIIVPRPPCEIIFSLLRKKIKSKIIAGYHGTLRPEVFLQKLYEPIFLKTLTIFNCLHTPNEEIYYWLERLGFQNIFYIPNAIDTNKFKPDIRNKESIFNILFVGRLVKEKGIEKLIEIIDHINKKPYANRIRFIIAGAGPLQSLIENLEYRYENITYLGFIKREALPRIYNNSHLFLMPTKTEVLPLTILEAQSCGLPVVCSKIAGLEKVIMKAENGHLIDQRDPIGFANAIDEYFKEWQRSPKQYFKHTDKMREYMKANYNWDIIIRKFELMLTRCAKSTS